MLRCLICTKLSSLKIYYCSFSPIAVNVISCFLNTKLEKNSIIFSEKQTITIYLLLNNLVVLDRTHSHLLLLSSILLQSIPFNIFLFMLLQFLPKMKISLSLIIHIISILNIFNLLFILNPSKCLLYLPIIIILLILHIT